MNTVECPVCGRRYRFDHSKMIKEKMGVKCRKCENSFVISRDMFRSSEADTSPPSSPVREPSPPPEDVQPVTLIIRRIPNETARLRIATRLMPLTGEKLSALTKRLSKTPAMFHLEMTPTEANGLLKAIESMGTMAEFSQTDLSRRGAKIGREDFPKRGWKRWMAVTVLMVLLVLAGGLSYHMYREVKKTHIFEQRGIDSAIPSGAFLYIRCRDIEENLQRIQDKSTNRGIVSLVERLRSIPQIQSLLARKRELESSMGVPFFDPDLMDFIGSDMRVALYGGNASGGPQVVFTLKGNLKIKLMETLGKWIPYWYGSSLSTQTDRGQRVYTVRLKGIGREIYFFSEGLIYIVSTSPNLIRTSRSLVEGQLSAKSSLKSLSVLAKKGEGTGINRLGVFYVDFRNLIETWLGKGQGHDRATYLMSLGSYRDLVGTLFYGRGLVVESTLAMDDESLEFPLRTLFESPSAPNKTLAYVPRNTIFYASNTGLDLANYFPWLWKNLKNRPGSSSDSDNILDQIKAKTGLDIEKEILPFLGREFSYAIVGIDQEGTIPLPAVQVFFEVTDPSRLEASIQKSLKGTEVRSWFKKAGVDLMSTSHDGVPITSVRYQGGERMPFFLSAFTPSYAFVGDFWVFGTRLESLRRVVDLSKGRGISMLKDRRFEEMKRFFRSESHGMAYMDLRATSLLLRNPLNQGLVAGFFKSGGERGRDLQFFLQLLETLNYVWSQAEFEGEHVRFLVYAAL